MTSINPGHQMGPYTIARELGRGGMGEVYLATDTRLDRDVAIKILPEALARDPERVARFQREAKLLASLNHANIAGIYGFEEAEGKRFLVLEYVEGQTLAARLKNGPVAIDDALEIAKKIAAGLEAAHDKGVIHRDLKPGNVMLTSDGTVKVLDFGLAKAMVDEPSDSTLANSPTITANYTKPGVVLGTAAYMSPEQARGRTVDKRTDIWSFGCVVFEMLTGSGVFAGETVTDSIGAILHKEPDWSLLPPSVPPTVQLVLRRCLAKNRDRRMRDIGDARVEIEEALADPSSSVIGLAGDAEAAARRSKRGSRRTAAWIAAAMIGAVGLAAGWLIKPAPSPGARVLAQIPPPPDSRILFAGDVAGPVVVSPDGRTLAFVAQPKGGRQHVFTRALSESEARPLSGTEGAVFPFWSPDSRSIGYFLEGKLKRADLATGTTITVCDAANGRGGSWAADGYILFAPDFQTPIFRVRATGGRPVAVTTVDKSLHTSHRWPYAIGDGSQFLFSAVNHDPSLAENARIYLGSLDGSPPKPVVQNSYNGLYVDGRILFAREGVLLAAPLDLAEGRLTGDPVAIVRDVATDPSTWRGAFSVGGRVLAYHEWKGADPRGNNNAALGVGAEATQASWYNRNGDLLNQIAVGLSQVDLRLSPDGKQVALSVARAAGYDIWVFDVTGGTGTAPSRLTFMAGTEVSPVWSPDGMELAFCYMFGPDESEPAGIYRKRIGGGIEELLVPEPEDKQIWPTDWSRDGKYIAYVTGNWIGLLSSDVWIYSVEDGSSWKVLATDANEHTAQFSPNGKWLAYVSDESGLREVYVIPFDGRKNPAAASETGTRPGRKWQVSVGGGNLPRWRADGQELFYMTANGMLMAVAVNTEGDSFQMTDTTPLFQTAYEPGKIFDVSPDGQSFIINEIAVSVDTPISLVLNWMRP